MKLRICRPRDLGWLWSDYTGSNWTSSFHKTSANLSWTLHVITCLSVFSLSREANCLPPNLAANWISSKQAPKQIKGMERQRHSRAETHIWDSQSKKPDDHLFTICATSETPHNWGEVSPQTISFAVSVCVCDLGWHTPRTHSWYLVWQTHSNGHVTWLQHPWVTCSGCRW